MSLLNLPMAPLPGRVETRDTVADRIIAARINQAEGTLPLASTAVVELSAGLWERAFASATCDAMDAPSLALFGRAMLLKGQSVWYVPRMRRGRSNRIVPVSAWDVHGRTLDPAEWRYRLTLAAPDTARTTVNVYGNQVVNVCIGTESTSPWRGVSPLVNSRGTRQILELVEARFRDEASMPTGAVLPVPKTSTGLADDVANMKGQVVIGATMAGGWGAGDSGAARRDWQPSRIGADVPESNINLWRHAQSAVLASAGIPPELASGIGQSGSDAREGWRRFLHSTIGPVGALLSAELRRVGRPPALSFDALFASDLQGRARSFRTLVDAGMMPECAARICGFEDVRMAPMVAPEREGPS